MSGDDRGRGNSPAAKAARAHQAKKNRPKKEVYDLKDLMAAGKVPYQPDLWLDSGKHWRATHRWIPLSILWIKVCCLLATIVALVALAAIVMRDPPVLLLSYPDGSIRCAPTPIDLETGKPKARPNKEKQLCAQLAAKFGE